MLRQGPIVPPTTGTVIHQRTIRTQPHAPTAVVIAPPPPPSAVIVVTPAPQPPHGVRVVHHGHNHHHGHHHHHGAQGLVGVHKPPRHVHHVRVMNTHGTPILPSHTIARGQQPSLRTIAASNHGTNARPTIVSHAGAHPIHPNHINSAPTVRRVIHK